MKKVKKHFPNWCQKFDTQKIINELIETRMNN